MYVKQIHNINGCIHNTTTMRNNLEKGTRIVTRAMRKSNVKLCILEMTGNLNQWYLRNVTNQNKTWISPMTRHIL